MREFFSFISLFHFIIAFVCVCVSAVVVEWFECLKNSDLIWKGRTKMKQGVVERRNDQSWNEQVRQTQKQKDEDWWWREKKKCDDCCWKNDWWKGIEEWQFEKSRMKKQRNEWWKRWLFCCFDVKVSERMNWEMCGIESVVERTREVGWLKSSGWFDDEMREVFNLLWRWMEWCG